MTNIFLWLVVLSTIITSVVNFAKPAYKKFTGKYTISVNVFLSFVLWVLAAFSTYEMLGLELSTWALIILWLALGTGSNIVYDVRELLKGATARLKKDLVD